MAGRGKNRSAPKLTSPTIDSPHEQPKGISFGSLYIDYTDERGFRVIPSDGRNMEDMLQALWRKGVRWPEAEQPIRQDSERKSSQPMESRQKKILTNIDQP